VPTQCGVRLEVALELELEVEPEPDATLDADTELDAGMELDAEAVPVDPAVVRVFPEVDPEGEPDPACEEEDAEFEVEVVDGPELRPWSPLVEELPHPPMSIAATVSTEKR
jgi:hypothetical protein